MHRQMGIHLPARVGGHRHRLSEARVVAAPARALSAENRSRRRQQELFGYVLEQSLTGQLEGRCGRTRSLYCTTRTAILNRLTITVEGWALASSVPVRSCALQAHVCQPSAMAALVKV